MAPFLKDLLHVYLQHFEQMVSLIFNLPYSDYIIVLFPLLNKQYLFLGSFGVYSALETSDVKTIDLYAKLGFVEVIPGVFPNNIFMARSF